MKTFSWEQPAGHPLKQFRYLAEAKIELQQLQSYEVPESSLRSFDAFVTQVGKAV